MAVLQAIPDKVRLLQWRASRLVIAELDVPAFLLFSCSERQAKRERESDDCDQASAQHGALRLHDCQSPLDLRPVLCLSVIHSLKRWHNWQFCPKGGQVDSGGILW